MLLVLSFTLVLVAVDESGRATERQRARAAEAWTDEALGTLPPRSLLLVRSEAAAFRVWAARVARGERPDLLVVPLPLLHRGDTTARLLALEPRLGPLIRELRVSGKPSEYALSSLADARPLFLEFDPAWDGRLLEHLLPHAFWMQFAPHALGRSDRTAALREGRESFARVLRAASEPVPDPATLGMLGHRAREQAVLLAALGDRDNAREVVSALGELPEASGLLGEVQQRLTAKSGRVDWLALLR